MKYAEGFSIYILQQTGAKMWMASISVRPNVRSVSVLGNQADGVIWWNFRELSGISF